MTNKLPSNFVSFGSYMDHSSKNYGLNSVITTDNKGRDIYFSYKTIVGFQVLGRDIVCIKNYWGPTTGKHLNVIEPDKKKRLSKEDFELLFNGIFSD